MDIVASTSLTFVAGVAEGRSVLKHFCKTNGFEDQGVFIPSLVYGAFSLPLTVVGSSPSVELVAKYSTLEIKESGDISFQKEFSTEGSEGTAIVTDDTSSNVTRIMKLGLPGPGFSQKQVEEEKLTNPAGGLNVAQMREDNRRAIAAMNERKFLEQNPVNKKSSGTDSKRSDKVRRPSDGHIRVKGKGTIGRRLATGLPSSFAENMRRSRILLFGYSTVSAIIAYQEYQNNEEESTFEQIHQAGGRDSASVQKYMNCNLCEMGVAIRILNDQSSIKEMESFESKTRLGLHHQNSQIPCSLPVISEMKAVAGNQPPVISSDDADVDIIPFWNLGRNGDEWDELPLNRRMFFDGNGGSEHGILFESTASTSIIDGLFLQHRRDAKMRKMMERTDINSRKIQHAIINHGEGSIRITHIVVGTIVGKFNRTSRTDIVPSQRIFINSMDAISLAIGKSVNDILMQIDTKKNDENETKTKDLVPSSFTDTIISEQRQEDNLSSSNPLLIIVDNVGKKIRNGGTLVINSVSRLGDALDNVGKQIRQSGQNVVIWAGKIGNSFVRIVTRTPAYRARINIFSDNASIVSWLKGTFNPKEFTVVWHDTRNSDPTENMERESSHEEIYLVLCTNDDTTIHATTSIMSSLPSEDHGRIISVVESVSSRDTLDAFHGKNSDLISICVSTIHEELFAYAKNLLLRKNASPEKAEKIISAKLKKL